MQLLYSHLAGVDYLQGAVSLPARTAFALTMSAADNDTAMHRDTQDRAASMTFLVISTAADEGL